jgi:hypothetical protein
MLGGQVGVLAKDAVQASCNPRAGTGSAVPSVACLDAHLLATSSPGDTLMSHTSQRLLHLYMYSKAPDMNELFKENKQRPLDYCKGVR